MFATGYHIGPTLFRRLAIRLPSQAEYGEEGCQHPLVIVSRLATQFATALVFPFPELGTGLDPRNPHPDAAPIYNSMAVFDTDGRLHEQRKRTVGDSMLLSFA